MNWHKILRVSIIFFLILGACQEHSYSIAKHSKSQEGTAAQQYIPRFTLPDSTGQLHSVEQLMGKATLIDFWASWCRPCRESANPAYKKLYDKFHAHGFNIVGVSSDRHQYFWKKALQQDSLPWFQLIDSTHIVLKQYRIKSIPAMFLINRHGKIIGKNLWGEALEFKIDSLLRE